MAAEVTIPVDERPVIGEPGRHGERDREAPLTPSLSPAGRGRSLVSAATVSLLGGGDHRFLLPAGEKVPEGRMRGMTPACASPLTPTLVSDLGRAA
jgi:hypothetical protein